MASADTMASRLAEVKTRAFDLDAEFDHMSTQGSWYKRIPLPTEFVVVPCWLPVYSPTPCALPPGNAGR